MARGWLLGEVEGEVVLILDIRGLRFGYDWLCGPRGEERMLLVASDGNI